MFLRVLNFGNLTKINQFLFSKGLKQHEITRLEHVFIRLRFPKGECLTNKTIVISGFLKTLLDLTQAKIIQQN